MLRPAMARMTHCAAGEPGASARDEVHDQAQRTGLTGSARIRIGGPAAPVTR